MKETFRLSGTGGQGLITAGIILAEAALLDGRLAVQSQSYGPEARGGSSKAEVIISDTPIYFGRVTTPDTLLVMSQEAANKFASDCGRDTTIIYDDLFVTEFGEECQGKRIGLPITRTAVAECKRPLFSNIVALGAVGALTGAVSEESLKRAMLARIPKGTEELNMRAFEAGRALASGLR